MEIYKYPVNVTIGGITLTFKGPRLDPVPSSAEAKLEVKEGFVSEYFLWKDGDSSKTHRVDAFNNFGYEFKLYTKNVADYWYYKIDWDAMTFKRSHNNGPWEVKQGKRCLCSGSSTRTTPLRPQWTSCSGPQRRSRSCTRAAPAR